MSSWLHLRLIFANAYYGDKQGWSLRTDYKYPRAFLIWVPLDDGPRVLTLDCVPGNNFGIRSEDVDPQKSTQAPTLALRNGSFRYDVQGEITHAVDGETFFQATLPGNRSDLSSLARKLLPILEGRERIAFSISSPGETPAPASISVSGLGFLMREFKAVCFGR